MPRNLTPLHLRCAPLHCPSIHQMDSGEYLIVGKSATMAAACDRIPVGEGEHAVIVSGELVAGVARSGVATEAEIEAGARALAAHWGEHWECSCLAERGADCDCGDAMSEDRSDRYDERPSRNDCRAAARAVLEAIFIPPLPLPPAEKEPS